MKKRAVDCKCAAEQSFSKRIWDVVLHQPVTSCRFRGTSRRVVLLQIQSFSQLVLQGHESKLDEDPNRHGPRAFTHGAPHALDDLSAGASAHSVEWDMLWP